MPDTFRNHPVLIRERAAFALTPKTHGRVRACELHLHSSLPANIRKYAAAGYVG